MRRSLAKLKGVLAKIQIDSKAPGLIENIPPKFLSKRELLEWNISRCSWIDAYYGNVATLVSMTKAQNVIEVGVAYGYHAKNLLTSNANLHYTGIDPYVCQYDQHDSFASDVSLLFGEPPQTAMDSLYQAVNEDLAQSFGSRANLIRQSSTSALVDFRFKDVDLIFLDGNHKYEFVSEELIIAWDCLKVGGILCGDDYNWPGVKQAVDEFARNRNLHLHFISKTFEGYATWFIEKIGV